MTNTMFFPLLKITFKSIKLKLLNNMMLTNIKPILLILLCLFLLATDYD